MDVLISVPDSHSFHAVLVIPAVDAMVHSCSTQEKMETFDTRQMTYPYHCTVNQKAIVLPY